MATENLSMMAVVTSKNVKTSTKYEFFKTDTSVNMITTILANAYREATFQETMYETLDYCGATKIEELSEKKRQKIITTVRMGLKLIFKPSADQRFHYNIVKETLNALQKRSDVWMLFCSSILVFDVKMAEGYPLDGQSKEFMDWLRIADVILNA
jgi:hypothetical protein